MKTVSSLSRKTPDLYSASLEICRMEQADAGPTTHLSFPFS